MCRDSEEAAHAALTEGGAAMIPTRATMGRGTRTRAARGAAQTSCASRQHAREGAEALGRVPQRDSQEPRDPQDPRRAPRAVQCVFRRRETKYLLTEDERASLEALIGEHMVPDAHGPSTTRSVYLDTPDYLLARRSIEHPLYKEKLRLRSYRAPAGDDLVFLELKKKYDGVVYKRRTQTPYDRARLLARGEVPPRGQIEREIAAAVARYGDLAAGGLRPAMLVAYDRVAFFGEDDPDFRMTLDRNVRYRTSDVRLDGTTEGTQVLAPGQTLLEVKCSEAMPLWLVCWMTEHRVFRASFSKYGAAYRCEVAAGAVRLGTVALSA